MRGLEYVLLVLLFSILLDASQSPHGDDEASSDIGSEASDASNTIQGLPDPRNGHATSSEQVAQVIHQRPGVVVVRRGLIPRGVLVPVRNIRVPVHLVRQEPTPILQIDPVLLLLQLLKGVLFLLIGLRLMYPDDATILAIRHFLRALLGLD